MADNPYDRLFRAAYGALHALRSYEHGNQSPDLAGEIADQLQAALAAATSAPPPPVWYRFDPGTVPDFVSPKPSKNT